MDASEARAVLIRHLECSPGDDTLLGGLRPYRGVQTQHLAEILHALLAAAPRLNGRPEEVDRDLIVAIWDLCRTARMWTRGPREPMFHGLQFISEAEKKRLDRWTDKVESIALSLLRGRAEWEAFDGLAWYVVDWELGSVAAFLAPVFIEMLRRLGEASEGVADADDEADLCRALGSMGPAAREAADEIRSVARRSPHPEAREAASNALEAILRE